MVDAQILALDTDYVELEIRVAVSMVGMVAQQIVRSVRDALRAILFFVTYSLLLGTCPSGTAWVDKAYAVDKAHQTSECSNAGICDRLTGLCACFEGFTGSACQRSKRASVFVYIACEK